MKKPMTNEELKLILAGFIDNGDAVSTEDAAETIEQAVGRIAGVCTPVTIALIACMLARSIDQGSAT